MSCLCFFGIPQTQQPITWANVKGGEQDRLKL